MAGAGDSAFSYSLYKIRTYVPGWRVKANPPYGALRANSLRHTGPGSPRELLLAERRLDEFRRHRLRLQRIEAWISSGSTSGLGELVEHQLRADARRLASASLPATMTRTVWPRASAASVARATTLVFLDFLEAERQTPSRHRGRSSRR
jgi:hypothetical protein